MLKLRDHHLIVILLIGAIVLSSFAYLAGNNPAAKATCGSGATVIITSPSNTAGVGTTSPLAGIFTLKAYSTPTTASGLSFMALGPNQLSLGSAVLSGSQWRLDWDSRNIPNGPYQLVAIAHYGTSTSLDCASAAVPVAVNNVATQSPTLVASVTPNTWQGPVGASANFTMGAVFTDQYGRQSHVTPATTTWLPSIGQANPNGGPTTTFNAGTAVGTGLLKVGVSFSGLTATAAAAISVVASTTSSGPAVTPIPVTTPHPTVAPTPSPNAASGSGKVTPAPTVTPAPSPVPLSTADATRLASMPTIFRPAAPSNSDPVVNLPTLSCIEKAVGSQRFADISSGNSQLTAAEKKLAAACFSGAEAIPAAIAPVAPARLTELPTADAAVTISGAKAHTVTNSTGQKVNSWLVEGTGAPNSGIFVYVFSDPLVLRATTDSQGKWSYELENSLPSGKHEIYAVAEQDSNSFVRTSAIPIQVAAAAPATDGALVVLGAWTPAQSGFVAGAIVLVLLAIGLFIRLIRRRRAVAAAPALTPADSYVTPVAVPTLIQPSSGPAAPAPASNPAQATTPAANPPDSHEPSA